MRILRVLAMKKYILLVLSLTFMTLAAQAADYQFTLKDGTNVTGVPQSLSAESVTVQSAGETKTLALSDVASIVVSGESADSEEPKIQVELSDGSTLMVKDVLLSDGQATLNFDGAKVTVPESQVVSVRFNSDKAMDDQWSEMVKTETRDDLLIVEKDGKLRYHRGHIEGITAEKVPFVLDGSSLPVSRAKAFGVRLVRAFAAPTGAEMAVGKTPVGSSWSIASLDVTDGTLSAVSRLGQKIAVGSGANEICSITFSVEPEFYLSDMKLESWTWSPFVSAPGMPEAMLRQFNQPHFNEGIDGATLTTNGQTFSKGVCVRSKTDMTFRLSQNFSRLTAQLGIDDSVRPKGSVEVEIFADDQSVFKATVSGQDPIKELDVPLMGAKRVRVVVDFGAGASVGDVLIIGSPRLWE